MLRLLESETHRDRLVALLRRWRTEEQVLRQVLHELQCELERWHRDTSHLQLDGTATPTRHLRQCAELQLECDALATELVHVRMAVLGLAEELELAGDGPPSGSLQARSPDLSGSANVAVG